MTLEETLNKLSEVHGVKFSIRSKKNYNQCITAHFNRGESLEEVLKVIGNIFPDFKYKIEEDNGRERNLESATNKAIHMLLDYLKENCPKED